MSSQTPPPGWYPAPGEPGRERWWSKPWPARNAVIIVVAAGMSVLLAVAGALAFLVVPRGDEIGADVRGTSGIEDDLEQQIDVKVGRLSGERIAGTRVDCPAEVEWQVGDSFRCDVTVPGQTPGYAEVTMETGDGRYSWLISNQ